MEGLPVARPLYAEDLAGLCGSDVAAVKKSLESRPKGSNIAVALLPDVETIQWHHAREDFVATELHGKTPKVKGAMVGTEKGKRIWCYWTRMWSNSDPAEDKGNTLHILRLVVEEAGCDSTSNGVQDASASHGHDAAVAALMLLAQREAAEWKMEHVEIWSPSPVTVSAAQKLDPAAKVISRDAESIASLQWYPEHKGPVASKIDWVGNEKYGWC